MFEDIRGKRALITGASSGLGAHFGAVLAKAGAEVTLAARRIAALDQIRGEIGAAGGQAEAAALDVTQADGVAAFFATRAGFDILINCAGIPGSGAALDMPEAEWDRVLNTNLKGAFLVSQAAAEGMKTAGGGAIVNIASILGLRVAGHVVAYTASKAALVQLTKATALEWARYGIRVNALCPGYIETPLNADFFATPAGEALVKRIPQRRLGRMTDLEGPLLLLCSEAGRYMTGTTLVADGGHLVSSL